REVDLARPAVKADRDRLPLARPPGEPEEEVHVPGLPAQLAVGDAAQTRRLLERNDLSNGGILGGAERRLGGPAGLPLAPERLERGRAEEASDVIGPERRPRRRGRHPAIQPYQRGRCVAPSSRYAIFIRLR